MTTEHEEADAVKQLRAILQDKRWIGFDLDDTLHDFRKASKTAREAVFRAIVDVCAVSYKGLVARYPSILRETTVRAFTDGKTSYEYRRARFAMLLRQMSISDDPGFLSYLIQLYERTFMDSLLLKPGALELLTNLQKLGKHIVVVSEGPHDAQQRVIEHLGLVSMVESLISSNRVGVSKADGLFPLALNQLQIDAADLVFVGDSVARDIVPATAAGIFCIHFAEREGSCLTSTPPTLRTLPELKRLFEEI
jgi:putative hydrolase of the HAD superfamily